MERFVNITILLLVLQNIYCLRNLYDDKNIRFMTYNIQYARNGIKGIIETIEDIDPHVVALQEVDRFTLRSCGQDQVKLIADELNYRYHFTKHFSYQGGEYGLAVLSKFPILQSESIPFKFWRTKFQYVLLKVPYGRLAIINAHLRNSDPVLGSKKYINGLLTRIRQVKEIISFVSKRKVPVIIMCDLNAEPISLEYRLIKKYFKDSCNNYEDYDNKTWPSEVPYMRFDYIWLSKGFVNNNCRTINILASDHLPVYVDVRLK